MLPLQAILDRVCGGGGVINMKQSNAKFEITADECIGRDGWVSCLQSWPRIFLLQRFLSSCSCVVPPCTDLKSCWVRNVGKWVIHKDRPHKSGKFLPLPPLLSAFVRIRPSDGHLTTSTVPNYIVNYFSKKEFNYIVKLLIGKSSLTTST